MTTNSKPEQTQTSVCTWNLCTEDFL